MDLKWKVRIVWGVAAGLILVTHNADPLSVAAAVIGILCFEIKEEYNVQAFKEELKKLRESSRD